MRIWMTVCALAGVWLSSTLHAGDLDPPAGPLTPTMKPLDVVEPRTALSDDTTPGDANSVFKITQSGSYFLVANVAGEAGKSGIEIAADNVTVDLRGFTVQGVAGSLDGITTLDTPVSADIRNGVVVTGGLVVGWGEHGIRITGVGSRVSGVTVRENAGPGILVDNDALIERCVVQGNGNTGIISGKDSAITDCVANANGGHGIVLGSGGFDNDGGTITECVSYNNDALGFVVGNGATVAHCSASANTSEGFLIGAFCTVTECNADRNGSDGYACNGSAFFTRCAADANQANGFDVGTECTLLDCAASNNDGHGIIVLARCRLRGNTCMDNDGDGIHAEFPGLGQTGNSHISGNTCISNAGAGFSIGSTDNVVVRNACSENSTLNWSIISGNAVAPIVSPTTNGAMISGDTYGGPFGTTDPWANVTY